MGNCIEIDQKTEKDYAHARKLPEFCTKIYK
jgi:hypothetical protein